MLVLQPCAHIPHRYETRNSLFILIFCWPKKNWISGCYINVSIYVHIVWLCSIHILFTMQFMYLVIGLIRYIHIHIQRIRNKEKRYVAWTRLNVSVFMLRIYVYYYYYDYLYSYVVSLCLCVSFFSLKAKHITLKPVCIGSINLIFGLACLCACTYSGPMEFQNICPRFRISHTTVY